MPRTENQVRSCPGGLAFGRFGGEHKLGKQPDILCFRCKKRLGCSSCCPPKRDIICKACRDWGSRDALDIHGRLVPREKVSDAMKIIAIIVDGKLDIHGAGLLFKQLFEG